MSQPQLISIACMSPSRVIGYQNRLPWHLPQELAHFKKTTLGHALIMGRKTLESLPKLLPGRTHIVLTKDPDLQLEEGHFVVRSIRELFELLNQHPFSKVFVAGGESIYRQLLPHCHQQILTITTQEYQGDSFYPELDPRQWERQLQHKTPEFEIYHYQRKSSTL